MNNVALPFYSLLLLAHTSFICILIVISKICFEIYHTQYYYSCDSYFCHTFDIYSLNFLFINLRLSLSRIFSVIFMMH